MKKRPFWTKPKDKSPKPSTAAQKGFKQNPALVDMEAARAAADCLNRNVLSGKSPLY